MSTPLVLPPAAPVRLSAEERLAYVLRHFALAYASVPPVSIGYAGAQPQVEIAEVHAAFFAGAAPYPAAPTWRAWRGQQVPFFFDDAPTTPLLTFGGQQVVIAADIIAGAFYLLSGWQEYFSTERDRYGRFPYAASVQQQYGFVALPVVNYYFDVLRVAIEHATGQPLRPRRWGQPQAEFAACISHDVDNLRSAWKAPAKAALRAGRLGRFGRLLWRHLTQPDAWDNLEAVAATTAQYGARSTFFILPTRRHPAAGPRNADYALTPSLRRRLHRLAQHGSEIGLHGSFGTATDGAALAAELTQVGATGLRFHYLSWEPRRTPATLAAASTHPPGCHYDATLGFAEHFGFRHSYCQPFYPFDFARGAAAGFLEIPLIVMDATLHHPHYLQLAPTDILPALQPVFAEIKRFGGVASLLWHNENFDPANTLTGPRQLHEVLAYLQQQGAAFLTGRAIWQELTAARPGAESYFF